MNEIKPIVKARWAYKPGHLLTHDEYMAFDAGWNAAMKFMSQPRIPEPVAPQPEHNCQPEPPTTDATRIPLVAFYTE